MNKNRFFVLVILGFFLLTGCTSILKTEKEEKLELPVTKNTEFVEFLEYKRIGGIELINGKLSFLAGKPDGPLNLKTKSYHYLDGSEYLENGPDMDRYKKHKKRLQEEEANKLPIIKKKNGKNIVKYKYKEYGEKYDNIYCPKIINDEIVFLAKKDDKIFVSYNKEEIGKDYDFIGKKNLISDDNKVLRCPFVDIDGKLAFKAGKDGYYIIYFDGKEIGDKYKEVDDLFEIKNKLAYIALNKDGINLFYNNKSYEITREVHNLTVVNDKLLYNTYENGETKVYYNDQEVGEKYPEIYSPEIINDTFTFMVKDGDKTFIVYGGKELGREYQRIGKPIGYEGKLIFKAAKENADVIFIEQ